MLSKLDMQIFMSEFKPHWVLHSYGIVPHLSKKQSELLILIILYALSQMVSSIAIHCLHTV